MSGPIVRSAPSKKFSQNWSAAFGGGKSSAKASAKSTKKPAAAAKPAKPAKKKSKG